MTTPKDACDIVMKGGITSGVVYPLAIYKLSQNYRFENIGGTSAGAIAAVMTAAAEYGRETGGFEKIKALPEDLSTTLIDKFQPTPQFAPLFQVTRMAIDEGLIKTLRSLPFIYWRTTLMGAVPGLIVLLLSAVSANWALGLLGLLLFLLLGFGGGVWGAVRQITVDLPAANYGMCPGTNQPGFKGSAISDWMTDKIDLFAGLDEKMAVPDDLKSFTAVATYKRPLTIRDLKEKGITVATVTTDLTSHRPYKLPMDNNLYFFKRTEFMKFFPERVVLHMCATSQPVSNDTIDNPDGEFYYFRNDDLPAVVLARMSLSFPFLFTTVPLYRCDYTFKDKQDQRKPVKSHFSDGGISSNFPVHFFDQFLPHTPTFGIALDEIEPKRFFPEDAKKIEAGTDEADVRVRLPTDIGGGRLLPTSGIGGVVSFLMAMFNSAKDWQDSLQSILTGYRERIVTVSLKNDEGGLNLSMPAEKVEKLIAFGEAAGQRLIDDFALEEHRWRRVLVEMTALEEALANFSENWTSTKAGQSYEDLLLTYKSGAYSSLSDETRRMIRDRAAALAALSKDWAHGDCLAAAKNTPKTRSEIRNTAHMGD